MLWICKACDGEYSDPDTAGFRYFHVCPEERLNPAGVPVPVDNRRDENVSPDYEPPQGGGTFPPSPMRRPGAGRVEV